MRNATYLRPFTLITVIALFEGVIFVHSACASEYLGNNQRTGYADTAVPAKPILLWMYKERHPPRQAAGPPS